MSKPIYDFAGIGIGPFNLGLACLTEPIDELNGVFLDENEQFDWHPGMMLEDASVQTPFMSDLVTLADPTNPYSFLHYVKQKGEIYSFYIRENFFLLREEYNQYCQWAARSLPNMEFNTRVTDVEFRPETDDYLIHSVCSKSGTEKQHRARRLVLGTGTVPSVPDCCEGVMDQALHSSRYLDHRDTLKQASSISLIGSGQSGAEIYYDLLRDIDTHDYRLDWITRSPRYFPLEYHKLTLEMTSPDYVDYFYDLPAETRDELVQKHKHLYKGINGELIDDIYDLLYTKRLTNDIDVNLWTHSALERVEYDRETDRFHLDLYHTEQETPYQHDTEALILATGYTYQPPAFLDGIRDRINWDERGRFDVDRFYSIGTEPDDIYVQNAELHTHGFVTPDLGMACYRNSCLIREMTGEEYYPIEENIAFQDFGAPDRLPDSDESPRENIPENDRTKTLQSRNVPGGTT